LFTELERGIVTGAKFARVAHFSWLIRRESNRKVTSVDLSALLAFAYFRLD
jgi:hypothetical protein